MNEFEARVLRDGHIESRRLQAQAMDDARRRLQDEGLRVLSLRATRRLRLPARKPRFALGIFIQELGVLLDAGLVLVEAMEALRDKGTGTTRQVLAQLLQAMYQGMPFSGAMARLPEVFPPLLVATAASSEHSGQLALALRRYRLYEAQLDTIRARVRGAMMYPAVVVAVGVLILLFMLFFVVPRFAAVFDSVANLPAGARFMVWWGAQVEARGMAIAVGMAGAVAAIVMAWRTAAVRGALSGLLWRIPALRAQRVLFVLARFYRTIGMLLSGGMTLVEAIELAGGMLPPDYRPDVARALAAVRAGQPLAATLTAHRLATPVAERLLRVGEQSGEIASMCERIALFHDEALERAIEVFSKVFGPVLMLVVGGLIGLVVFLLYMPIFELAGAIQE
ncbi:type II secretion system protein [Cupriavidus necator]|uniref:General secretion pathway protein F n=1 Tax=Cupriavidus necator TaxID=106590 RepID=A0A1U9UTZ6_CUPNE|nr:type II secretion system F family protein [Cupriavidus necator]AQV95635.1 type II secretion system protein [Cupriavidus necator]